MLRNATRARDLAIKIGNRRYTHGGHMQSVVLWFCLGAYAEALASPGAGDMPDHELGLSSSLRPFSLAWMSADLGDLPTARS